MQRVFGRWSWLLRRENGIILAIKIAFAYVGAVIGAGFASGQEIMQFFTVYGNYSVCSIFIATFLFIWVGISILTIGFKLKPSSFRDTIRLVFGIISPFVNAYIVLAMVIIGAAMLAGSGVLFEEYARIPFWMGAAMTAAITWIIVIWGIKGIFTMNTWIIPLIIAFNIFIFGYSLQKGGFSGSVMSTFDMTGFDVIKTGVSYASFNIILSVGVLSSAGAEANHLKALSIGGLLGGSMLGTVLLMSNYSLMRHVPAVFDFEVPMLYIVYRIGGIFSGLFAVVMGGAILTTLVANVFSVTSVVHDTFKLPVSMSSLITIAACFMLSFLGFSHIVSWVYPLLGIIGFVLIAVLLFIYKK
jgi:uncharacterized membrane protein YkvI